MTTVKELREQLSRFPDDAPVIVGYGFSTYAPLAIGQTEEGAVRIKVLKEIK